MKDIKDLVKRMTTEEKILMLTGFSPMGTEPVERLGIPEIIMADGPHGIRTESHKNNVSFPCTTALASTWNRKIARKTGNAMADECINNKIDLLLAPGINIKRYLQCGRNFEYFSEDPVVTGEMASEYINGVQEKNVGVSVKHFALNNQEKYRNFVNVEADRRTLFEIYLKAFETVVKKSKPASIMCAENKYDGIWCSEHGYLLNTVLKEKWGYEGFVISDWSAVKNPVRALKNGMDLQMPTDENILKDIQAGLESGEITEEVLDGAVSRILSFVMAEKAAPIEYDRKKQHETARESAMEGIVLLKNENNTLPITKEKYKKIAVFGEYAENPLIGGQGSAEVYTDKSYISSPLEELRKAVGNDIEISYYEYYKKLSYLDTMIWPKFNEFKESIEDSDLVVFFAGSMISEDTEEFDRRSPYLNPNFEFFINQANMLGKKTLVVLQNGSAVVFDYWNKDTDAIVEMWLSGEGGGEAIADILTGKANPSGKLAETFPKYPRRDIEYPGDGVKLEYSEKLEVGYRYYDKHPEEVNFPFGHGLSYTDFEYSALSAESDGESINIKLTLENTGEYDGAEVIQVYSGIKDSAFTRPLKELKAFEKIFLEKGEKKQVEISLPLSELAYFNPSLDEWIIEPGIYTLSIGSSSADIRLSCEILIRGNAPYTVKKTIPGVGML